MPILRYFLLGRYLFLGVVLSAFLVAPGFSRSRGQQDFETTTRAVKGVVTEPGGKPVEGAVVLLKDAKTLQIRSYVTKEDGVYRFFGLSANDQYELRAQRNGVSGSSKTLSQFDTRKQTTVDLKVK